MERRAILEGNPHRLLGNLSTGDDHPQYLRKQFYSDVLQTLVPASTFGARPNTGLDVTVSVQSALDGGANYFAPGTYLISSGLRLQTTQPIWAWGAVLDYGTAALAGPAFTVGSLAAGLQRPVVQGLKLIRTYTTTSVATWLYTGFHLSPVFEGIFLGMEAEGFQDGFLLEGDSSLGAGCTYNLLQSLRTFNCKYAMHLRATSTGDFVNENVIQRSRFFISNVASIPDADRKSCKYIWIERQAASSHAPNNNLFQHCTLEGYVGRKVQCEGLDNYFVDCRYEDRGTQWVSGLGGSYTANDVDIQIGNGSFTSGQFSRNQFLGGYDLNNILSEKEAATYTGIDFYDSTHGSGGGLNNKNQFQTGWSTWWNAGNAPVPAWIFEAGGATSPVLSVRNPSDHKDRLVLYAAPSDSSSGQGSVEWRDSGGTMRNLLALSPSANADGSWTTRVKDGLYLGDLLQVYPASPDVKFVPNSGGRGVFAGGTSTVPPLGARNSSSANPAIGLYTSGDARILFITANPASQYGAFIWYDAGTTEINRMYVPTSGTVRPVVFDKGLRSDGEMLAAAGFAHTGGDFRLNRTAQTGNYTVLVTDSYIASFSGGAARTVTLPAISGNPKMVVWIKDSSYDAAANNLTIARTGSDKIDNVAGSLVVSTSGAAVQLIADGANSNWEIF